MERDSLGDRMKNNYENRNRTYLTRRTPVIIRLDGKAFHTLTRGLNRPFDEVFICTMINTCLFICSEIQGAKCAYVQSDEISILITDFDKLTTDAWFDYNVQKITSISSGLASAYFTKYWDLNKICIFDSRVFNIPKEEVCNYFIWRQQDWIRNSVQMLAQSLFSHKELHQKNQTAMKDMIFNKGVCWEKLENKYKNGTFIYKNEQGWKLEDNIIFKESRNIFTDYLTGE